MSEKGMLVIVVAALLIGGLFGFFMGSGAYADRSQQRALAAKSHAQVTWEFLDGRWACTSVEGDPDAVRRAAEQCQPFSTKGE